MNKNNAAVIIDGPEEVLNSKDVNNPKIIFADEPTGNLDAENAERLIDLLLKVKDDFDLTIVLSTHNKKLSKLGNKKFEK